MAARVLALVVLIGLAAGAYLLVRVGSRPRPDAVAPGGAIPRFDNSQACAPCHPEVYAEWRQSQHAIAFLNPVVRRPDMADGFRKKDCLPCHAPRPVFEHGLGKAARVLARDTNRAEGVDCLACHETGAGQARAGSGVLGPCFPVTRPELASTDLCAPCHNQHNTVDEWERSPAALRGTGCGHCHMPAVTRRRSDGSEHRGAFHGSRGGNDPELLRRSATVAWTIAASAEDRVLQVSVTNTGVAHNLPTDARHRAVDLVVTLEGADGRAVAAAVDPGPGEAGGTARLRFRNPYREEYGKENTQIPSGETRTLAVAVPAGAARADIRLLYKRSPFVEDADAAVLFQQIVDL
jgi:hypothetical protein